MRGIAILIIARARRWPARSVLPALGIALAVAFAGAVRTEATVAGSQAAQTVLDPLSPLERVVRINWQGDVTPTVSRQAIASLRGAGLGPVAEVLLLNPVRLNGELIRPAAIDPLAAWTAPAGVGPCRPAACPMRLADGRLRVATLADSGVRLEIIGRTRISSAAPLGYQPVATAVQPPVLVSGDVAGLDRLAGLSGIYRGHSWFSLLATRGLAGWQLPPLIHHLQQAQAALEASSPAFSLAAPFTALEAARTQAEAAPSRLLLVGGGALAAILMFVVLTAGGLRAGQQEDLARLRLVGARAHHCLAFVAGEAALLCLPALAAGAGLAVGAGAALASSAGVPVWGALTHSVLTPVGGLVLLAGWVLASLLLTLLMLAPARGQATNVLAIVAGCVLGFALLGRRQADSTLALVLAPLACLACGILVFRIAAILVPLGERGLRRGPVLVRLAVVSLARGRSEPALAIAFLAVSTGLGGFALLYRATLARSGADQAAQQVPLDAIVSPAADFTRPLALASLGRWHTLTSGRVLPVRRTDATYLSGGASVGVPALGVPAAALPLLHDWRAGELPASPAELVRRMLPPGPPRVPGPVLPSGARRLMLAISSPHLDVSVTADLRAPAGDVVALGLGVAGPRTAIVSARMPPGHWELEAVELNEPTGLQLTNDHQNGEGAAAATQHTAPLTLGPIRVDDARARRVLNAGLGGWRGVGAARARAATPDRPGAVSLNFSESGLTGILRPEQPSDGRALPILVDRATAAAAHGGRLALNVDGLPVAARVAAVLRRFPTIPDGSPGFVVADEASLASALDAEQPGQGRADELWVSTTEPRRLRTALHGSPLSFLGVQFRADVQRSLLRAPTARAVLGTLTGAAALGGVLALLGLLVVLTGAMRDRNLEADLQGQGLGPRALRTELRLRVLIAGALGVGGGLMVALLLGRLSVAAVRAADGVAAPDPPVVAVAPLGLIALWTVAMLAALASIAWVGTLRAGRDER